MMSPEIELEQKVGFQMKICQNKSASESTRPEINKVTTNFKSRCFQKNRLVTFFTVVFTSLLFGQNNTFANDITAAIDAQLLNLIDQYANSYYDSSWNVNIDQYKAWVATIAWAEGGKAGYGAHSGGNPTSLTGDIFRHNIYGYGFHFSTGIGPFQLDRGSIDNWENWPTADKLDAEKAALSVLKVLRTFPSHYDLSDFAWHSPWFAVNPNYNPGGASSNWAEVTGTDWTTHRTGPAPLDWASIKSALAQNAAIDPRYLYDYNVESKGLMRWNIKLSQNIKTETGRDVIFDGDYNTWLIRSRRHDQTGSERCRYYYTFRSDLGPYPIEVWVYDNSQDSDSFRYIFIRECNGPLPEHREIHGDGYAYAGEIVLTAPAIIVEGDITAPTIDAFTASPVSVAVGNSFTLSYTVSDAGGSGLRQVELWRSDGDGSESDAGWEQLQTNDHSGNGPVSGGFQDSPSSGGTYWYGIHVTDNANNYTDERLAGLGPIQRTVLAASRIISLSGNLNFGSVTVGNSSNRTLSIANNGTSALTVSSITYPSGFSGAWNGSIPVGGSQNVTVTFSPTSATSYSGTVTVNSDATSGTNTIGASGNGSSAPTPIISLSGDLAFGNIQVGTTGQRAMTIANIGNSDLTISSISYPAGFSGAWSGSIPSGGSQNVTVTFDPTQTMSYSGTVTVNSNATSGTNTISASGAGTTEPPPDEFWKSPTASGQNDNEWTNPNYAYSSDGNYATATGTYLEQDYYNFNFDVPVNAIINGIEVAVEGHGDKPGSEENRLIVDIWSESSQAWSVKNNGSGGWWFLGSSGNDAVATGGSETDLWGQTWQSSDFANNSFKLRIKSFSNPDALFVDHVQVRIYWNAPVLHSLTTSSSLGGTVSTPGEGTYAYNHGTAASVIASPAPNFHFVNWTGTALNAGKVANPNSPNTTVTMDSDYTIQANFAATVNNPPVLAPIGNKSVNENSSLSFSVSATDADNDPITYSATGLPSGATFSGQSFTWAPNYDQANTYNVTFIASDGIAQDSETITITVNNTNRAPVLASIGNKSVDEGSLLSFSISAMDADGDTITYSVAGPGSLSGQTFTWTPGYDQAGIYAVTFTASDGTDQDYETIGITVNNVNAPPVLAAIGNQAASSGSVLSFTISATDADDDEITYTASPLPSGASLDPDTGAFAWTPTLAQAGTHNITFTASDGTEQASETITITVNESSPPEISGLVPEADSIQIARDTVIQLHITDSGSGVAYDGGTVTIYVEGDLIYDGANENPEGEYDTTGNSQTVRGVCTRSGTEADYTFVFEPSTVFDYEQEVNVTVDATDRAGNAMPQANYHFHTVMRTFGPSAKVNSDVGTLVQDNPATAVDSSGNIWIVWDQTNAAGDTDIYIGKLPSGGDFFEASVPVVNNSSRQRNPDIAINAAGRIYVVWQGDDINGNWDVFISSSTDGTNWSAPSQINTPDPDDSPSNQTSPAIALYHANTMCVAWEDDSAGNKDIWGAIALNDIATRWTMGALATDASDQTEPVIAVGGNATMFVIWTDSRNIATTGTDIYGGDSDPGPAWVNLPVITTVGNQSNPVCTDTDQALHLLWVDDTDSNGSIFYASITGGFEGTITPDYDVVDERSYGQSSPAIAAKDPADQWGTVKVFACWQDSRWIGDGDSADIYFAETTDSSFGTNILVNDDGPGGVQTKPAIGINSDGDPYIVWADDRSGNRDIYYAGPTAVGSLPTEIITNADGSISVIASTVDNLHITVPAGALPDRVDANNITIAEMSNLPAMPSEAGSFGTQYKFGPSGLQFNSPVTIRIPHDTCPADYSEYRVYRYDPTIPSFWSEEGIRNPATHSPAGVSPHYLEVQVDHFSTFAAGGSTPPPPDGGGGGGGGGCALSTPPHGPDSIAEFLLPYVFFVIVLLVISLVDARRGRAK